MEWFYFMKVLSKENGKKMMTISNQTTQNNAMKNKDQYKRIIKNFFNKQKKVF